MYLVIRNDQGAKSTINDLKNYYDVSIVNKSKGFYENISLIQQKYNIKPLKFNLQSLIFSNLQAFFL